MKKPVVVLLSKSPYLPLPAVPTNHLPVILYTVCTQC